MKIQKILSQNRRDFQAIYECEHCGYSHQGSGYDDAMFTGLSDIKGNKIYVGDWIENYAIKDKVVIRNGVITTERSIGDQPLHIHKELTICPQLEEVK